MMHRFSIIFFLAQLRGGDVRYLAIEKQHNARIGLDGYLSRERCRTAHGGE